jgi:ParB family transcriptional regulator, chromosome partitioning protein
MDTFIPPIPERPVPDQRRLVIIDSIDIGERLRPTDTAYIQALCVSIRENAEGMTHEYDGLIQPIIVKPQPGSNRMMLVAGCHRLEAAKLMGWEKIPAIVRDLTPTEALLAEIDENIFRRGLSQIDMAVALLERKKIYESLHPETKNGGDTKKRKKIKDFNQIANLTIWESYAKDAARKTGLSQASIYRYCDLATTLGPDLIAKLRRSRVADNGSQLRMIANMEDPERRGLVVEALSEGRAKNFKEAQHVQGISHLRLHDPDEQAFEKFFAIWHRASPKAKRNIRDYIAKMDQLAARNKKDKNKKALGKKLDDDAGVASADAGACA